MRDTNFGKAVQTKSMRESLDLRFSKKRRGKKGMKRRTSWKKYIILAGIAGLCFILPQKGYAADANRPTIDIDKIDLKIFEIESLEGGYTLRSYKGEEKVVYVPDGIQVIGDRAFEENGNLEEVILPQSVKSIRDSAFLGCVNLKCVRWADDVEQEKNENQEKGILEDGLEKRTEIQVAENSSGIEEGQKIGNDLVSLMLPSPEKIPFDVNCIGHFAFSGCTNLVEVVIPEGVERLGWGAFGGCKNLRQIELPETLRKIERKAFCRCEALENINIPRSVSYIDEYTFEDCKSIRFLEIPETMQYCLDGAFKGCTSLETVVIPKQWREIPDFAFEGCENLKKINLPEQLSSIGENCFYNCKRLEEIYIPKTLIKMGSGAFVNTGWMEKKRKENPFVIVNDILLDGRILSGKIKIPKVSCIGEGAFWGSGLKTVEIPESVTEIGEKAFEKCKNLKEVKFLGEIGNIPDYCFKECSNLESVKLPKNAKAIGNGAFFDCKKLKKIKLPKKIKWIGDRAFGYCEHLKEVVLLGRADRLSAWGQNGEHWGYIFSGCPDDLVIWGKDIKEVKFYGRKNPHTFRPLPGKRTVTFVSGSGKSAARKKQTISFGKKYGKMPEVSRKGYALTGWYTMKKGGEQITADTLMEEVRNHKVYAHWKKIKLDQAVITQSKKSSMKVNVKWKKVADAEGYEVSWADNRDFQNPVMKRTKKRQFMVQKTGNRHHSYVRVRAYRTDSTGTKIYGAYSKVRRI